MKKVVKSKVAAQKLLRQSDNGKIFNNNNSGEFWPFTVWLFCVDWSIQKDFDYPNLNF